MMIEKNSVIEENSSKVSCAYEDKMGNTTNNVCFEQNINVVNIEMEKKSPLEKFNFYPMREWFKKRRATYLAIFIFVICFIAMAIEGCKQ